RFCVSTLNKRAGVSKLMKAPWRWPSNARRTRWPVSSREDTSKVTVVISRSPEADVIRGRRAADCQRQPERRAAALLEPADPFQHEIELHDVVSRLCGDRDGERRLGPLAR